MPASSAIAPSFTGLAAIPATLGGLTLVQAQRPTTGRTAADASEGLWRATGWALLILVIAVTAILLAMWVKRQILGRSGRGAQSATGFTLADLRQLHRDGKISQAEYERTRDRLVLAAQTTLADAAKDTDAPPADAPRTKDVDLIREAERSG